MKWSDEAAPAPPPDAAIELALQIVARGPDDPQLLRRLGLLLSGQKLFAAARDALAKAARIEPETFDAWPALALCHIELDAPELALAVCEQGAAYGDGPALLHYRGVALKDLGRPDEAKAALLDCLDRPGLHLNALKELLRLVSRREDGEALLALVRSLPERYHNTVPERAYRAIALSRTGQVAKAMRLYDLDRFPMYFDMDPPPAFGGIDAFNARLADDLLGRQRQQDGRRPGFSIRYTLDFRASPALQALESFLRASVDHYVARLPALGLDTILPPLPKAGRLSGAGVILTGQGRNTEHVHVGGYLSLVYHVQVPEEVRAASDNRGALALGCCSESMIDEDPCWRVRFIKPVPGRLTIFPSHIFHDTIPTGCDEARISVAADLLA